ncbi:MAG TPA: hypothetical protein ENI87_14745, partial [bacterium]|nr:hypothetical protein [bacterium]
MPAARCLPLFVVLAAPALAQSWVAGPTVPTAGNVPRALGTAIDTAYGFFLMGGTPAGLAGDAPVHKLVGSSFVATTPLTGSFLRGGAIVDELGQILVIGGVDAVGALGDSYIWTEASGDDGGIEARLNAPDAAFMLAHDDLHRVLSVGGSVAGNFAVADPNGYVERYDAWSDLWTPLAPMPTPVADGAACNDGLGHVLVFGGYDTTGARTANVARFDLATGVWSDTAIPDMPTARAGHRCALGNDGRIYVVGGSSAGGVLATVDILDPATGTWVSGPAMSTPREHFGCTVDAGGYLWAIGGDTTNTSEKLFTPTCPTIVSGPDAGAAITGAIATLSVDVIGSAPLTYQWRRDGVPLGNGPTGSGSTVAGADTAVLTFQFVAAADAQHVYDCVVGNACGSVTSAAVGLALADPPQLPSAFVVEARHPSGAISSRMNSIDGGVVVGSAKYPDPTWTALDHPMQWTVAGGSAAV